MLALSWAMLSWAGRGGLAGSETDSFLAMPDRLRPDPSLIGVPACAGISNRQPRHTTSLIAQVAHAQPEEELLYRQKARAQAAEWELLQSARGHECSLLQSAKCCMQQRGGPSCSMLPLRLLAGAPVSTPDTPLTIDMLLPDLPNSRPAPGAPCGASACIGRLCQTSSQNVSLSRRQVPCRGLSEQDQSIAWS